MGGLRCSVCCWQGMEDFLNSFLLSYFYKYFTLVQLKTFTNRYWDNLSIRQKVECFLFIWWRDFQMYRWKSEKRNTIVYKHPHCHIPYTPQTHTSCTTIELEATTDGQWMTQRFVVSWKKSNQIFQCCGSGYGSGKGSGKFITDPDPGSSGSEMNLK